MKTTNIQLRAHISERSAQLQHIAAELKTELFGIDDIIDRVVDTIRAWYVLPDIIKRPVIVNLWGLTGTGKTQLIRSLSKKLGFYDRLIEVQMDGYSNGGGTSIGSMLSDSAIAEGTPGILVLDEFQRFRTVDHDGRERKVEHYMDVWGLLSDGKLPPNISFLGDMERRLAQAAYRDEYKRLGMKSDADEEDVVAERLFVRNPRNELSKFALTPYQAQDFKATLKLKEPIMEIMTWSPQDLHSRLVDFMQDPHAWETDYSKLLIFVCGNLDEMYADAASRVEDCDTDADVFHAMTRKLSLIDVKRALSERFKPEQIARLGNNHVVYPSLNRSTYQKLIEVAVHGYLKEIEASSGLRFEVTDAVKEQIYANSVFPTQGTRPVFSSVHGLMSAPLVDFTLWALEQGAGPGEELTIDVDPDAGLLISRWGHRIHTVPVAFEISKLRQRPDPDMRAVLAVHEAGHGLIYALLFRQAPLEIRINMATFSGGYNSFNALKVKTRGNLLDAVCVALSGRAAEEMVYGMESLSSGSENDLKLATQQMAAFIRHAAFGKRISHVDVSTEAGEDINTDVAGTNSEIEAGLQTQYERAQTLLAENRAIYLRMVNELINEGQLAPQKIREWLGLSQPEVPKDALEPFDAKLREFERRVA